MSKKRNRELSKLIDFPNFETKDRAQSLADKEGISLKKWIEQLIIKKTK